MDNIRILEDNIINQIAAGEVVERPSSIVKELVENSIDAGATSITVETKEGGISLIRVSDNGGGIPSDEVLSAFMRHATSKISNMDDLERVMTLGFRGEALSSIASVSQVEIITKTPSQITAKRLEIEGGKVTAEQDIGAVDGTTIKVRNIFFNTPARRKFLKKPGTESGYISDIMNKVALGHPHISFRYVVNDSEILYTNGNGDLKTVIFNVYGKDVAKKLIKVEHSKDDFKIEGYICHPEINRSNRSYGNIFINGRFIKSDIIQSAVEEAYKTKIIIGKFPVFVLNLTINPRLVDVNVHPTKLEVRFSDERRIFDLFFEAVDTALKKENLIPSYEVKSKENPFAESSYQIENYHKDNNKVYNSPLLNSDNSEKEADYYKEEKPRHSINISEIVKDIYKENKEQEGSFVREAQPKYYSSKEENEKPAPEPYVKPFFNNFRIIGQFFNTYWIVEQNESIFLIDQHAAHERVLFEKFMKKFKSKDIISQRLLSPLGVDLSQREREVLMNNMALFGEFGFEIEAFDDESFALLAVPFILKDPASPKFFMDIIDMLSEEGSKLDNIYDTKIDAVAMMSCKAAVKGNDRLSYMEAKNLIDELLKLENPFTCPHGRPTVIELKKYEIEKMFKRIQ